MVKTTEKTIYAVFEEYDNQRRLQDVYENKADAEDAVDDYYNRHVDEEPNRDRGIYGKLIDHGMAFGYWVERVDFHPDGDSR